MNGGYDEGYKLCDCFWGESPGSLINILSEHVVDYKGLSIIDIGCGEGKNAIHLARLGARVDALDVSEIAIEKSSAIWPDRDCVSWECADVLHKDLSLQRYDVVVAYGLLHCMRNKDEVSDVIEKIQGATKNGGFNIVCAFNDREQDLTAHPNFNPTLLSHKYYIESYEDWEILFESDEDLHETHPHNNIPHTHSMTRIIAKKVP